MPRHRNGDDTVSPVDVRMRRQPAASRAASETHPVHQVHRVGAALLGVALVVFGVLGLVNGAEFFARTGEQVMGMGSNGALAVLSLAVGAVLLYAAARGGRIASTTTITVGGLFLLSGFVHLAILDTGANLLGFVIANVLFSFAVGIVLLTLGAYGRLSGGLAADNPYARGRARQPGESRPTAEDANRDELARAEIAATTGTATPHQQALVDRSAAQRADAEYDRAWRNFAESHTEAETAHMRDLAEAESALPGNGNDRRAGRR